ncbi:MAG: DUF1552 domain-containing protein [Myxococcales bacterium]|nr:MAG: DUF1552 domain-containing protein [Myxococcales bacterium]
MRKKLQRRAFLAGVGGTVVALPFLDIMRSPKADAQTSTTPKRYLVCFGGVSLGKGNNDFTFAPSTYGENYDLTGCMASINGAAGDMRPYISVVSNLKLPWGDLGSVPAGGRIAQFHKSSLGPLLSGMRNQGADISTARKPKADAPTSDQIVADAISSDRRFHSLQYRVQASYYRGGGATGVMSYGKAPDGSIARIDPIASPRVAYDSLFTGFIPDDPALAAERQARLAMDQSVIDLVSAQGNRLMANLGTDDRQRMEQHFDEIRALENRLKDIPDITESCYQLDDPGQDDPIETYTRVNGDGETLAMGYANEEGRAEVMVDLIRMAFACDMTRVGSLMFTHMQSYLHCGELFGANNDMHELGHSGGTLAQHDQVIDWHVKHFTRLVSTFKDTPDVEGSLLDNSALVLVFEGGHGYDPEADAERSSHSTENMAALVAGHAGGMRQGRHIDGAQRHASAPIVSAMNAVGVTGGLHEVQTRIDELFE